MTRRRGPLGRSASERSEDTSVGAGARVRVVSPCLAVGGRVAMRGRVLMAMGWIGDAREARVDVWGLACVVVLSDRKACCVSVHRIAPEVFFLIGCVCKIHSMTAEYVVCNVIQRGCRFASPLSSSDSSRYFSTVGLGVRGTIAVHMRMSVQ